MQDNKPASLGTHIPFTGTTGSLYEMLGGMETFRQLADGLYRRIDKDPVLRHMFPEDLTTAKEHMALFLAQFFGGPQVYNEQRGHPRLRSRHLPFKIGQAERDAWLGHMLASLEEAGITEPALTPMRRYFEDAATFLINQVEKQGEE
jgi:hemoglobin